MKQFVVNRRNRDQELTSLGKGSSEGIPPVGAFIVSGQKAFVVVGVVFATHENEAAAFIVCDPHKPAAETPESVEAGRDPVHVVRGLIERETTAS